MLTSRLQNAGQNQNIQLGNKSFENSVSLKYFGRKIAKQKFAFTKTLRAK
jgi:hypothetical protein